MLVVSYSALLMMLMQCQDLKVLLLSWSQYALISDSVVSSQHHKHHTDETQDNKEKSRSVHAAKSHNYTQMHN